MKKHVSIGRSGIILAIVLAVAASSVATSASARSKAPLGYQIMCLRTPSECQGGGSSVAPGTPNVMATLKRVNSSVNQSIRPHKDGGTDTWDAAATSGDCEDYVLAKRRALIKAGLPSSSLRIAYVKTRGGVGHAILVVKTTAGDFVLDNLNKSVRPLSQAGYRIISMSGVNPRQWG